MIRVAICDDEPVTLKFLQLQLQKLFASCHLSAEIECFKSGNLLLERHKLMPFDILFLDIDMPRISGFAIAEKIREISEKTYIVFVTSKEDLMYQSFDYQPFHFICKRSPEETYRDLERVVRKLIRSFKHNLQVWIQDNYYGPRLVTLSDIYYIKSEKHYLIYYLTDPSIPYLKERGLISDKEKEFEAYDFVKSHKQYLVNMIHISHFDILRHTIRMTDGTEIPISKSCRESAAEKFRLFKRR